MMMTQAYYTGISGLQSNSTGINVLSDNLANIDTIGYRGYTTEFSSLFESTIATPSSGVQSIGKGVHVQATSVMKTQGPLTLSERSTDLAIEGNGWFGVKNGDNTVYTRDGAFTIDTNADLVTADGFHVLGTMGGNISKDNVLTETLDEVKLSDVTKQEELRFPKTLTYPPKATTKAKFTANIGVGSQPFAVGASVVDAKGNKNSLRLEFTKSPVQTPPGSQYDVTATLKSLDGKTLYDTQKGVVSFNKLGALTSSTLPSVDNNGTPVAIDLGNGYDGIVAMDKPPIAGSSSVDGTIGGDLQGYTINKNAEVVATFTNGQHSSVGKIGVFHFVNEQGLDRLSGSKFKESSNSGKPFFYTDASDNNITGADIKNFRLESSNVTMSFGLSELIVLQRAYDANSKSITTADQMMQKALNMDA